MKIDQLKLKKISITLVAITSILAVLLSVIVYYHPLMQFDISVSRDFQGEGSTPLEHTLLRTLFLAISFFGRTTVAVWVVLVFSLLFWFYKYYWENLFCLLTLFSSVINSAIKFIIARPRPTANLVNILDHQISPSYPSGHVVFFTVFYGFLFAAMFFTKRFSKLFRIFVSTVSIILIILVSFSRIYLGAHWLTDVLGGYLLGFSLLILLLYFYLKNYLTK